MRFIRHLIAALLVVALIVVASVLWAHTSGGTGHGAGPPPQAVLVRIGQIKTGRIPVRSNDGINITQYQNLVRTGLIETALAAAVVTIGIIRRQHHRAQRVARGTAARP
jgi:hypothetical protein